MKNANKKIISKAQKVIEDKKSIQAYLRGEILLKDLNDKGIKPAMPL